MDFDDLKRDAKELLDLRPDGWMKHHSMIWLN